MSFVTIDVWTLIFTWGNLIILYLLLKKFLFKPVNNVLSAREKEISDMYSDAETAKTGAENMRDEYTKRLTGAKQEAENILSSAKRRAQDSEEKIISEARAEAGGIVSKAMEQAEKERENAVLGARDDISSIAVSIASKVIEKNIDEDGQHELLGKLIDEMGGRS